MNRKEDMSRYSDAEAIPCNATLLVLDYRSRPAPTHWRTWVNCCSLCGNSFPITAAEQRFWYEELRIPLSVEICHCRPCRRKRRAHRRIMGELSDILPRVERGVEQSGDLRVAALAIAEGMIRRLATSKELDITVLNSPKIVEKGARIVAALRRESSRHDDLLPVQIRFHRHRGNSRRVERLEIELAKARMRSVPMARALAKVERWLETPTLVLRDDISEPPRG